MSAAPEGSSKIPQPTLDKNSFLLSWIKSKFASEMVALANARKSSDKSIIKGVRGLFSMAMVSIMSFSLLLL